MKPNEYIKKYGLNVPNAKYDQNSLAMDLALDFTATVEFLQAKNQLNYERFKGCVKEIKQKFDSISNKMSGCLPEGLWKYFYATTVVKVRDELFGEYLQQKKEAWEKKKAERDYYNNYWNSMFRSYATGIMMELFLNSRKQECFNILGLTASATKDEILVKFRELSLQYHPDKGGNQEKFMEIIRAKNECLVYINN